MRIEHYSLSRMDNIYSDVEEVSLNDNLRIVRLDRLTDPRAKKILGEKALDTSNNVDYKNGFKDGNRTVKFNPIEYSDGWAWASTIELWAETSNHALEYYFEGEFEKKPKKKDYDQGAHLKLFSAALTAFRLLKPEIIGRFRAKWFCSENFVYRPKGSQDGILLFTSGETVDYEPPVDKSYPYIFSRSNIDQLISVFEALCACDNGRIRIALSRLNRLYARENEIDKLIDIMVAFESLYFKNRDTELKFRLATRVAKHLGENVGQIKNVYECMRDAYDLRSDIVHGVINSLEKHEMFHKKKHWESPNSMLESLSLLLRKSLLSILLDIGVDNFAKEFHEKLDDSIISGELFKIQLS